MAFSNPEYNIRQLGLHEGELVADLGAGTGAYTLAAAKEVGGAGRVYAVEVQKEILSYIKDEMSRGGVTNVEIIWGDIERAGKTKIRDHTVDAVIIANVLFQVADKGGLLKEAKRILKPGGKALIVDWKESFGGMGPRAEDVFSYEEARALLEDNGFSFIRNIDAGDHHYGFIVKK